MNVEVNVFDVFGKMVNVLRRERMGEGMHSLRWNGTNGNGQKVPKGLYLMEVQTEKGKQTKRVSLF